MLVAICESASMLDPEPIVLEAVASFLGGEDNFLGGEETQAGQDGL